MKKIALVVCALVSVSAYAGIWENGTPVQGIVIVEDPPTGGGGGGGGGGDPTNGVNLNAPTNSKTGVTVKNATSRNGRLFIRK